MATIRRGNRGTQQPVVKLEVAGRTIHILSANGNIDHQVIFKDTAEQIEFAMALLGACPAMELAVHPKMQAYARMAATQTVGNDAHAKVQRFKEAAAEPAATRATPEQNEAHRLQCEKENKLNEADVFGTGTGQFYLEARRPHDGEYWAWFVYNYDKSGEHEHVRGKSLFIHDTQAKAIEAGAAWAEENKIEVQTM